MVNINVPRDLLEAAASVIRNAYAPYSGFRVAAAVRAASGAVYVGVNVENASYGLTVCAERVAVFNAVASGERRIVEVLVAVEAPEPVPPCGACRQVLAEFAGPETPVYSVSLSSGAVRVWRLGDLLPEAFRLEGRR
jgi:cytidine deaminase